VERTQTSKAEALVAETGPTTQNEISNPIEKDLEKGPAQDVSLTETKLEPNADEAEDPYLVSALTLSFYHISRFFYFPQLSSQTH